MKGDGASASDTSADDAVRRSLADDLRTLVTTGRELAQAEMAYQKARGSYAAKAVRTIAIATGTALALAFVALMALVLGLILTLAPILTPIGATVAVVAGLLIAAVFCTMAARASVQRMKTVLGKTSGDDDA